MAEEQGRVTIWGIEVFLAVTEEGSISAAARRLGVSPPAISQQVAALELTLGAVVFDRSARPFGLTAAGVMFRRHAQLILNTEAEARADLARADLSRLTTLRLGMIEDFDAEVTPSLLASVSETLPDCRFLLETGASHRLLDQLESRALDLAVAAELGAERTSATAETGWREVHPLLTEPFLAIRPKGGGEVPLIQYSTRHLMGRQIVTHLAQQNLRYPVRFELDSYHAILAMVAQGAGWTILTPLALHHAARFLPALSVEALPGAAFGRMISLSARTNSLGVIPQTITDTLRGLVGQHVVLPALHRWPWLQDSLRLL